MKLLEKLIPKNIQEEQNERVEETQKILDASRKRRRAADVQVIRAYRTMGRQVRRHEWSK